MLGVIPRYLAYINNSGEMILKLFNIFYKYIDKINEEYKNIQNLNAKLIIDKSKNIIEKIIIGGTSLKINNYQDNYHNFNQIKIDKYNSNRININIKNINNINNMTYDNYDEIKKILKYYVDNGSNHCRKLLMQPYVTAVELNKNNSNYTNSKMELIKIADYLEFLYKNIEFSDFINNLINKDDDDDEYLKYNQFINIITYAISNINLYKKHYKKNINLDGIYFACFLDLFITQVFMDNEINSLEFILSEVFNKHPMRDYFDIININSIIKKKNKKLLENNEE